MIRLVNRTTRLVQKERHLPCPSWVCVLTFFQTSVTWCFPELLPSPLKSNLESDTFHSSFLCQVSEVVLPLVHNLERSQGITNIDWTRNIFLGDRLSRSQASRLPAV